MKNEIIILLFCFILIQPCTGQGENNLWLFQDQIGLDFNVQPPTPFSMPINYNKWIARAVCDSNGNLLFYTNGDFLWNRDHERVPYGESIQAFPSSPYDFVISLVPDQPNKYYLFSTDANGKNGEKKLQYSIFDVSLSNGLGAIDPIYHRIKIDENVEGFLVIGKGSCLKDNYWLFGINDKLNQVLIYNIQSTGIIKTGSHEIEPSRIKRVVVSEQGTKLAIVLRSSQILIFKFNKDAGHLYDEVLIDLNMKIENAIFSPNGKLLYVVDEESNYNKIVQFDLSEYKSDYINNSAKEIYFDENATPFITSLSMSPTKRIYFSWGGYDYFSIINEPNSIGTDCSFVKEGLYFPLTGVKDLPRNLVINNYSSSSLQLPDTTICEYDNLVVNSRERYLVSGILWSDGDTSRVKEITDEGEYSYTITTPEGCEYSDTFYVEVIPREEETIIQEICPGDSIELAGEWYQIGETRIDTIQSGTCPGILTLQVEEYLPPFNSPLLPPDTTICAGDSVVINLDAIEGLFQWSDDLESPTRVIYDEGNYVVTLTTMKGCVYRDTLSVAIMEDRFAQQDTILCYGDELIIGQDTIMDAGFYMDTLTDDMGCLLITEITVEVDSSGLKFDTTRISISEGSEYEWNGEVYSSSGLYMDDRINNNGCMVVEFLELKVEREAPSDIVLSNILSANDDGINDVLRIYAESEEDFIVRTFQIYSRWGNVVHRQSGPIALRDLTWDGKIDHEVLPSGVYTYVMIYTRPGGGAEEVKTGTITLMR